MIYNNGNIYEGQWHEGKRNGYGVLTKRNGDHFEGHWVNDKRETRKQKLICSGNGVRRLTGGSRPQGVIPRLVYDGFWAGLFDDPDPKIIYLVSLSYTLYI